VSDDPAESDTFGDSAVDAAGRNAVTELFHPGRYEHESVSAAGAGSPASLAECEFIARE